MYLYKASNTNLDYFNTKETFHVIYYPLPSFRRQILCKLKFLDWIHLFAIIMLRTGKQAG